MSRRTTRLTDRRPRKTSEFCTDARGGGSVQRMVRLAVWPETSDRAATRIPIRLPAQTNRLLRVSAPPREDPEKLAQRREGIR